MGSGGRMDKDTMKNNEEFYKAVRSRLGSDTINPDHYKSHPSGVECIQITEHFDFVIGNIIKYAWRAGKKEGNTKIQDLEKCLWYAQRAVDRERRDEKSNRHIE